MNQPRMILNGMDPVAFYNKCHDDNGRFCDGEAPGSGVDSQGRTAAEVDRFAEPIARKYHVGEAGVDKNGNDYIDHHLRPVAESLPARLRLAGWLHDSLEDTVATPESLKKDGVDDNTIRIVKALTHGEDADYDDAIKQVIKAGPEAIDVKIADMTNNLGKAKALPDDHPKKAKWLAKYGPRLEQLHEERKKV